MAKTRIIGLAGPSGAGKSTIAAHIAARRGGIVVDADRIGHEVLAHDPAAIEQIRSAFGGGVFDEEGRVDRRALGAVVFSDTGHRGRLNRIVHPRVVAESARQVDRARADRVALVVVDAALLFEVSMPFEFDLTIALTADLEIRRARLLGRGDRGPEAVDARLSGQDGLEKAFYKADAVVDTGRELPDVLAEIDGLVDGLFDTR